MHIILVDPQTPFAVDGLLGADFLRRSKAFLDVKNKSLKIGENVVQLQEGEDEVVGAILPIEYSFPDKDEVCQAILDQNVTIAAQSQQIVLARLKGKRIKSNSCYVFKNKKVGKTPLFVASSSDQIKETTTLVMLFQINPSPRDIVLKNGTCVTHA